MNEHKIIKILHELVEFKKKNQSQLNETQNIILNERINTLMAVHNLIVNDIDFLETLKNITHE